MYNFRKLESYLTMTYKIISSLESLFIKQRQKRHINKEYVRTIEFVKVVSDIIADNILNAICDNEFLKSNEMTEKLLNEIVQISGETNQNGDDYNSKNIQFGIAYAIAEILTTAKEGYLPELKNKINQIIRVDPDAVNKHESDTENSKAHGGDIDRSSTNQTDVRNQNISNNNNYVIKKQLRNEPIYRNMSIRCSRPKVPPIQHRNRNNNTPGNVSNYRNPPTNKIQIKTTQSNTIEYRLNGNTRDNVMIPKTRTADEKYKSNKIEIKKQITKSQSAKNTITRTPMSVNRLTNTEFNMNGDKLTSRIILANRGYYKKFNIMRSGKLQKPRTTNDYKKDPEKKSTADKYVKPFQTQQIYSLRNNNLLKKKPAGKSTSRIIAKLSYNKKIDNFINVRKQTSRRSNITNVKITKKKTVTMDNSQLNQKPLAMNKLENNTPTKENTEKSPDSNEKSNIKLNNNNTKLDNCERRKSKTRKISKIRNSSKSDNRRSKSRNSGTRGNAESDDKSKNLRSKIVRGDKPQATNKSTSHGRPKFNDDVENNTESAAEKSENVKTSTRDKKLQDVNKSGTDDKTTSDKENKKKIDYLLPMKNNVDEMDELIDIEQSPEHLTKVWNNNIGLLSDEDRNTCNNVKIDCEPVVDGKLLQQNDIVVCNVIGEKARKSINKRGKKRRSPSSGVDNAVENKHLNLLAKNNKKNVKFSECQLDSVDNKTADGSPNETVLNDMATNNNCCVKNVNTDQADNVNDNKQGCSYTKETVCCLDTQTTSNTTAAYSLGCCTSRGCKCEKIVSV